ncbi:hypothetical protein CIB48_g5121 [Xylaria polymorpha]|nr:hypothetical protein CIB48_g5121 [Xylaria polymorpha]
MATSKEQKFAHVQGGGSLILAWQIKNKTVLVVGGGEVSSLLSSPPHPVSSRLIHRVLLVWPRALPADTLVAQVAAGRILNVLNADAHVVVVCPSDGLNPEVRHRIANDGVTHIDRVFEPADLETLPPTGNPPDMVLVAVDDPGRVDPDLEAMQAAPHPRQHRRRALRVRLLLRQRPRLAASIRRWIGDHLPQGVGNAIERVGELRVKLRQMVPAPEDGPKRMRWMTRVSDAYSWDDMCALTDEDMDNLLKFYQSAKVPELHVLKAMRGGKVPEDLDVFDGSFGFSVVA